MNSQQLKAFWSRKFSQIKEKGWAVVRRKARTAVIKVVKLPVDVIGFMIAVPVVLIVRLIRPLVWIRFGQVRTDVIGHSVFDPEYYLSAREVENFQTFDCFYLQTKVHPNKQWALMIRRHLNVKPWYRYLDKANLFIPFGVDHHLVQNTTGSRDLKGYLARTKTHFSFTDQENRKGQQFLESLGLKTNERFICLIVRDSAYKEKFGDKRDWSYHNYRNIDIDTYKDAVMALAKKGYWIFRMGKAVEKTLKVDHPRVLDFANSKFRCDFLDIWLFANCFFSISSGTGIDSVADIFRKPVVYVNNDLLTCMVTWAKAVTVSKKLYWINEKRFLTLTEQLDHSYVNGHKYEENGIEVVDLTNDEIYEAVMEMEMWLAREWEETEVDKELQKLFWVRYRNWSEFTKYHGWIHPESRVGAAWLRSQKEEFFS